MPRITIDSREVLADPENAVLGDVMTVDEPKPLRGQHHLRKRLRRRPRPARRDDLGWELTDDLGWDLTDDLGLLDMGVSRALAPYKPVALAAPEDDGEELAKLLVLPAGIVAGAAKGAVYGALLGQGTPQRRIGGGALGGAVAFPALTAIAKRIKAKLAESGAPHPIANAVVEDVAHVGGAAVSVVAAGGEAEDGAIAGAAVVVASHLLRWIVGS